MVLGITGRYCSGKSTLAGILTGEFRFHEIDVDKLGHEALKKKETDVLGAFGSAAAGADGSVDRRKLGDLVFSDPRELRRLESIVHPVMKDRAADILRRKESKDYVLNAAVLFRMGLDEFCDAVIIVRSRLCSRIRRARKRDSLSLFQVLRRFLSQRKLELQPAEKNVDIYTVYNDGDRDALVRQLSVILKKEGYR